jgi:hypothetical protein
MAQRQTRMLREFVWADGLAAFRQISRTRAHNLCQVRNFASDKRSVVERAYAKRNIDIVVDKVDYAIGHLEFECDARVSRQEIRQRGGKLIDCKRWECMDP